MRRRGESDFEDAYLEQSRDPRAGEPLTVIGSGARLEGNLVSASSLRIEGKVKGQITAEGDVIVAPDAEVMSDIRATNVTIAGRYEGNITANGTLELASTARVDGNISCRALIVNQGAVFSGQSIMGESDDLRVEEDAAAVEDA